jgi:hypothetical protein
LKEAIRFCEEKSCTSFSLEERNGIKEAVLGSGTESKKGPGDFYRRQ